MSIEVKLFDLLSNPVEGYTFTLTLEVTAISAEGMNAPDSLISTIAKTLRPKIVNSVKEIAANNPEMDPSINFVFNRNNQYTIGGYLIEYCVSGVIKH